MTDTNTPDPRATAVAVIRELAAQGHTHRFIGRELHRRGIPTLTSRGTEWNPGTVHRLMERFDIPYKGRGV